VNKDKKMKRLVIENETELACLEDMLKDLPYYLNLQNVKLSAITEKVRRDILGKIKQIQKRNDKIIRD